MIRLPTKQLSPLVRATLEAWQTQINALPTYGERVERASALFTSRNRTGNATFQAVRKTLEKMCSGSRRCCYCEDSCADEVEHIRPKALYPSKVFDWKNYLYACGPCNGPKQSNFGVLSYDRTIIHEVNRPPGSPVVPPRRGKPALIDPRYENALDFMHLDLIDTFFFVPSHAKGTQEYLRADYTIGVLRLNERDYLPRARGEAYGSYRARLSEYCSEKAKGNPTAALVNALRRLQHPTVWAEMKRQRVHLPDIDHMFVISPEALAW